MNFHIGRPAPESASAARAAELRENLASVRERLRRACFAVGRSPEEVELIVVTKTYPASDVRLLAELGVRQVAENRDQEAAGKAADCADLDLTWHFVGQLQTNKVPSVVRYADFVHSVDRLKLVRALSREAVRAGRDAPGRELGCLLQVNLAEPAESAGADESSGIVESGADTKASQSGIIAGRGGVLPARLPEVADATTRAPGLRCAGVMAVAPLTGETKEDPRAAFERLAEISSRLRWDQPAATMVSAGMSNDLEEAVAAGATHVRIGTAVLGARSSLG